jgi:hypothetical protein
MINIYMDFDGVINAMSGRAPKSNTGWPKWELAKVTGFPILWSPTLIEFIHLLDVRPDVTIKWLTSWCEDAPKELSPLLGIGADWPVLGTLFDTEHRGGLETHWWKLEYLLRDVEETKPDKIVWLDDDIVYDRWAAVYTRDTANLLAITPNTHHGLTVRHINDINTFINQ